MGGQLGRACVHGKAKQRPRPRAGWKPGSRCHLCAGRRPPVSATAARASRSELTRAICRLIAVPPMLARASPACNRVVSARKSCSEGRSSTRSTAMMGGFGVRSSTA
jgi:hypothetical protein